MSPHMNSISSLCGPTSGVQQARSLGRPRRATPTVVQARLDPARPPLDRARSSGAGSSSPTRSSSSDRAATADSLAPHIHDARGAIASDSGPRSPPRRSSATLWRTALRKSESLRAYRGHSRAHSLSMKDRLRDGAPSSRAMSEGRKASDGATERASEHEHRLPLYLSTDDAPTPMASRASSSPANCPVMNARPEPPHVGTSRLSPIGPQPSRRCSASRQFVLPEPLSPSRRFNPSPHWISPVFIFLKLCRRRETQRIIA